MYDRERAGLCALVSISVLAPGYLLYYEQGFIRANLPSFISSSDLNLVCQSVFLLQNNCYVILGINVAIFLPDIKCSIVQLRNAGVSVHYLNRSPPLMTFVNRVISIKYQDTCCRDILVYIHFLAILNEVIGFIGNGDLYY